MRFPKPGRCKRNKYGAVRTGDGFPSKLEAAVHQILLLREKAGEIQAIKRQASVDLGFGIRWKVDFCFIQCASGDVCYAEAKGRWTADAALKLRMWRNGAIQAPLEIWQGNYRKPELVEIVKPRQTRDD